MCNLPVSFQGCVGEGGGGGGCTHIVRMWRSEGVHIRRILCVGGGGGIAQSARLTEYAHIW